MKPRTLVWLAAAASAGFAYWLLDTEASDRELWLVASAWLLGFWLASGINQASHPAPDEDEEWDEEEYEDDDEEWEDEERN